MRRITPEEVFILLTFMLIYFVLVNGPAISGFSVNDEINPVQKEQTDSGKAIYTTKLVQFNNLEISDLAYGDLLVLLRGDEHYEIALLRISQDYRNSLEFAEFIVTPGNKLIFLSEQNSAFIDLNNDKVNDLVLSVRSISYGKVTLSISKVN